MTATPRPPLREAPSWDLVLKRNYVERLKREKFPLDIRDELPRLIDEGYETLSEEDIVRFQWCGLYHDKPKVGTFMLRIKIAGGILTPTQLRAIGEHRRALRQGLRRAGHAPEHPAAPPGAEAPAGRLRHPGARTASPPPGAAATPCATSPPARWPGSTARSCSTPPPLTREAASFFYGNRDYFDLPRKHKITIACCPYQCNPPEMHCIALIGTLHEGQEGFAVRVGGGLSTAPRIAKRPGDLRPPRRGHGRAAGHPGRLEGGPALPPLAGQGAPQVHGRRLRPGAHPGSCRGAAWAGPWSRLPAPASAGYTDHLGVHPQRQPGLSYVGFPVSMGWMNGEQMHQLADLIETVRRRAARSPASRTSSSAASPTSAWTRSSPRWRRSASRWTSTASRGSTIGCTGEPFATTP